MKCRIYFGILVCLFAGLCGCKKEKTAEKGKSGYNYEFVSEDYVQGGGFVGRKAGAYLCV